ncbi:MAG: SIGNAL peptide protein [Bacteroidetes bacterium B1(2017)]|nr:MAG: SIGNAL peptide protein [Bacteroidetes bacterium B1(2017)]
MKKILLAFSFLCFATFLFAQSADDVVGTWINPKGTGKIKIFRTGDYFYGNLVWLDQPLDAQGKPKLDKENPDVSKRTRKIQGLLMLTGFTFDADDKVWQNGQIYDPKNGKTYSCKMTLSADNNQLDIRGYIGISMIGRSETWKRVDP